MSIRIDGEEVPPETRVQVEEHLAGCPPCERWLEEETERSARLREHLRPDPAALRDFEEALLEAAREAGWDGRTLRSRRGIGRYFLGPGGIRWRNSLILMAAVALLCALPGLARLFQPKEDMASSTTHGEMAPSILTPLLEGLEDHRVVVPDSEGRPVEVRFAHSLYRYQATVPVEGQGGGSGDTVHGGEDADAAARPDGVRVERSELELEIELERVESRPVRLTSWPYQ